MAVSVDDEIMLEVRKLNRLIAECCPEVLADRAKPEPDTTEMRHETDALNRHRLSILAEAVDTKHPK